MSLTPIHTATDRSRSTSLRAGDLLSFDPLLAIATIGLALCSLLALHGSSKLGPGYANRQALYAGIGLVLALALARFDYTRLRELRTPAYVLLILLNLVVFGMPAIQHAHRWIPTPLFQFQSSEFGKLLLIVTLASITAEATRKVSGIRPTVRVLALAVVPALIVIAQPDLGTGLVYLTIAASILFFAGTDWKQIVALAVLVVVLAVLVLAVAPALGVHLLQGYQDQRLTTFINPPTVCAPSDSTCYQLHHGLIAIGSGGKTGVGVGANTQSAYGFIPEYWTDFIFAVVGETYGFVGAAVVLSLYALLIWRTLRIMTMSKNLFGTLLAAGIVAMFMFQVFLNVGMTLGIMPVTGVPLPLMSYGGSSVIVTFLAVGLLQSIHVQARRASGAKARIAIT